MSLEHLTGGLQKTIAFFGGLDGAQLRFVTKFTAVEPLLNVQHRQHTRARISLNATAVAGRVEGGVPRIAQRIRALRQLSLPTAEGGGGYPIGVVLAPIMPVPDWQAHYTALLDELAEALSFTSAPVPALTFELITHRFTEGSRSLLQEWYPATSLDMSEAARSKKFNKFGGTKYVYNKEVMAELKTFFYTEIKKRLPAAVILYWT